MKRFFENVIPSFFYAYVPGMFIAWDWDVSNWPVSGRITLTIIFVVLTLLCYGVDLKKDREQSSEEGTND